MVSLSAFFAVIVKEKLEVEVTVPVMAPVFALSDSSVPARPTAE
jgi:hypothetical protein